MENPIGTIIDTIIGKLSTIESVVLDLQNRPAGTHQEPEDLTDINGAKEITNLALSTIYAKVSANEIPYIKKGKKLRFSRKKLRAWILEGEQLTQSDAEKAVANFGERRAAK